MSACQAQRPAPPNWQSEVHGGGLRCAWDTEGIQSIAHGQRRVRERDSEEDKDASSTDGTEDRHGEMEPERGEKMRGGKGSLTPQGHETTCGRSIKNHFEFMVLKNISKYLIWIPISDTWDSINISWEKRDSEWNKKPRLRALALQI